MITSRFLKVHAVVSTLALGFLLVEGFDRSRATADPFEEPSRNASFDEITARRINVQDSEGRTRVSLAGDYSPRRKDLAGLLFHNQEGTEAGGLVYYGKRDADGNIHAGGILTFDQFSEDQIMTVEYSHRGDQKRNGLTIIDRPDKMSTRVKELYRSVQTAKTEEERAAIKREMIPKIPQDELPARRLYVGRRTDGESVVELCDGAGKPRLRMMVDQSGAASIAFLDQDGNVLRSLTP